MDNGVGGCARAAILKGFYKLETEEDLDQVILEAEMPEYICNHKVTVRLRDILVQPDYAGIDYEDGQRKATVFCAKYVKKADDSESNEDVCNVGRIYVTSICSGKPRLDSGRSHNHCNECSNYGKCMGDYRNKHCDKCGHHYLAGSIYSFPCNFCSEPKKYNSKTFIESITRVCLSARGISAEEIPDVFSDYGDASSSESDSGDYRSTWIDDDDWAQCLGNTSGS